MCNREVMAEINHIREITRSKSGLKIEQDWK